MDRTSTYALLGVPETLAIALVLVWLSLSLAPWLGGTELGPLKVPKLGDGVNRWLKIAAPLGLLVFTSGFLKTWPTAVSTPQALTYTKYVEGFFDPSKSQAIRGEPYPLNELEARQLQLFLGGTKWEGSENWGLVTFDESGRRATFTNQAGRSPGNLLIQGLPPGTIPILIGEWKQSDGQAGRIMLLVPAEPV